MTSPQGSLCGVYGEAIRGKVGVLIEDHFDLTEFVEFNKFFPAQGYQIVYMTHLWGQPSLRFYANPEDGKIGAEVIVTHEIASVDPDEFVGFLLIGAYAMDRLRYQERPRQGEPSNAPAVVFLRQIARMPGKKIGTICHSLWLLCADRELIRGRRVTCAHNIICDVENAGGEVVYDGDATADLVIDGDLISGKHPGIVAKFMDAFMAELEKQRR
jgi:protease I